MAQDAAFGTRALQPLRLSLSVAVCLCCASALIGKGFYISGPSLYSVILRSLCPHESSAPIQRRQATASVRHAASAHRISCLVPFHQRKQVMMFRIRLLLSPRTTQAFNSVAIHGRGALTAPARTGLVVHRASPRACLPSSRRPRPVVPADATRWTAVPAAAANACSRICTSRADVPPGTLPVSPVRRSPSTVHASPTTDAAKHSHSPAPTTPCTEICAPLPHGAP